MGNILGDSLNWLYPCPATNNDNNDNDTAQESIITQNHINSETESEDSNLYSHPVHGPTANDVVANVNNDDNFNLNGDNDNVNNAVINISNNVGNVNNTVEDAVLHLQQY